MSYITPFSSDQKVPAGHSDLERGVVPKDGMAPLPASVIWNLPTAVSVLVQGLPDAHLGLGGAGVGDSWWVPRWGAPCLQPGYAVPGSWPMSTAQATFAVLLNQSLTRMRQDVEKK